MCKENNKLEVNIQAIKSTMEFTKEHKTILVELIKYFEEEEGDISCGCPMYIECSKCPFHYSNSNLGIPCERFGNALGIVIKEHKKDEVVQYLKDILNTFEELEQNKNGYKKIELQNIKKYEIITNKKREMLYGVILFKNISFIANGGTVIVINENKTGGVIYGKDAKKHFKELCENNYQYKKISVVKKISKNGIIQISFHIENKKQEAINVYKI